MKQNVWQKSSNIYISVLLLIPWSLLFDIQLRRTAVALPPPLRIITKPPCESIQLSTHVAVCSNLTLHSCSISQFSSFRVFPPCTESLLFHFFISLPTSKHIIIWKWHWNCHCYLNEAKSQSQKIAGTLIYQYHRILLDHMLAC